MRFGLQEKTVEQIKHVFSRHPQIEQAILYGSRATGRYKNGSDIDITLKGEDLDLAVVNSIRNELDDLLLPYTFDISVLSQIGNADLLTHIETYGVDIEP